MGCGGGGLGAPLLGCSAFGAEQERIEWNGMSWVPLSLLFLFSRSDLVPYITR
jgi:hypothetical protein